MNNAQNLSSARAVWDSFMEELCAPDMPATQKMALLSHIGDDLITGEMLAACAGWLLERALPLNIQGIDVCGTGGDTNKNKIKTFNISTAVAFVTAAAGASLVKHGNRAVSSASGSSDVLAALGIPVCTSAQQAQEQHTAHNLCFVSAPAFHPTLSLLADIRRAVGRPTFLNLLGPLCNPARTTQQLFGVYDTAFLPAMMQAAQYLGKRTVTGVHSQDGLDEISISAPTYIYTLRDNVITQAQITPEDCQLARTSLETLKGGTAQENAAIILEIFKNPAQAGEQAKARTDILCLNAAAALMTADIAPDWQSGLGLAREALNSGEALRKLEKMREAA